MAYVKHTKPNGSDPVIADQASTLTAEATKSSRPERVWYLAYGSNINEARLLKYLKGSIDEVGARDPSPPKRSRWATVKAPLQFGQRSSKWLGGGVAFLLDQATDASAVPTWLRCWDLTAEQFEDVYAQENRSPLGSAIDWHRLVNQDSTNHGDGWYSRIVRFRRIEVDSTQPALTFTGTCTPAWSQPHPSYLRVIAAGLAENPKLSTPEIESYVSHISGQPSLPSSMTKDQAL